jgi:hypothetical protein
MSTRHRRTANTSCSDAPTGWLTDWLLGTEVGAECALNAARSPAARQVASRLDLFSVTLCGGGSWSLLADGERTSGTWCARPSRSMAWMASDEGRQLCELSSEQWCQASIAAGTPPADARAAAEQVTVAYTSPQQAPES